MAKPNPKFAGLTDDQVLAILKHIALSASVIHEMCMTRADEYSGHDSESDFHALDRLVCALGALADLPTGGDVVGDFATWMCGPLFHDGKEGERAA